MTYNPNKYQMHYAAPSDAEEIAAFYNNVIEYAQQQPERDIQWTRFTSEQVGAIADGVSEIAGEELWVVKKRRLLGKKSIVAAVIVNGLDYEAWQDEVGQVVLPTPSLHFAKYAADPKFKGLGREVLWPHLKNAARNMGYRALHCEAFNFPEQQRDNLRSYYEDMLGMTYVGPAVYYSSYYKKWIGSEIPVSRFYYPLIQDTVQS
jgi:hypothetical protein